jgi:protein-ribulosamine 3-kinase
MVLPVPRTHPLLAQNTKRAIEHATSEYLGHPWTCTSFTNLNDQASHPAGILHGQPVSVFAKLGHGPDAAEQFTTELRALEFVRRSAGVPIGSGLVALEHGYILVFEALSERLPTRRTKEDWRAIGRTLATLHQVHADSFGLDHFNGFFGPLREDNQPVISNTWVEFYAERRVRPQLRTAVDTGYLPADLAADVERLLERLPLLCGPEPQPALLHGDAQQHNFVSTDAAAVVIDVAPYFGHPELDLALVDYFDAVPDDLFAAYRDIAPIEADFAERRELWRVFGYLSVITVDGNRSFGRRMRRRLVNAVRYYINR